MINKHLYMSYLRNTLHDINPKIEYIYDINEIENFEARTGNNIGVISNQVFYDIILPLVKVKGDDNSKVFRYPYIVYPNSGEGAAALITASNGKENADRYILLVKQMRITNENKISLEIPRGFANKFKDKNSLDTALREVKEETGISIDKISSIEPLGSMTVDSGLSNNVVDLFHISLICNNINEIKLFSNGETEEIISYTWYTEQEVFDLIKKDKLIDSFTLCALLRYMIGKI